MSDSVAELEQAIKDLDAEQVGANYAFKHNGRWHLISRVNLTVFGWRKANPNEAEAWTVNDLCVKPDKDSQLEPVAVQQDEDWTPEAAREAIAAERQAQA